MFFAKRTARGYWYKRHDMFKCLLCILGTGFTFPLQCLWPFYGGVYVFLTGWWSSGYAMNATCARLQGRKRAWHCLLCFFFPRTQELARPSRLEKVVVFAANVQVLETTHLYTPSICIYTTYRTWDSTWPEQFSVFSSVNAPSGSVLQCVWKSPVCDW